MEASLPAYAGTLRCHRHHTAYLCSPQRVCVITCLVAASPSDGRCDRQPASLQNHSLTDFFTSSCSQRAAPSAPVLL